MESRMKRTIKDSVFTMLFSIQAYIMELYRALHPEDNTITPEELKTITLETALVTRACSKTSEEKTRHEAPDVVYCC